MQCPSIAARRPAPTSFDHQLKQDGRVGYCPRPVTVYICRVILRFILLHHTYSPHVTEWGRGVEGLGARDLVVVQKACPQNGREVGSQFV